MKTLLRFFVGDSTSVALLFEPRDLWVGVYWNTPVTELPSDRWIMLEIYLCLIPCLPIRVRVSR